MLAFLGVSFLTPIDGLFVLAAALPLAVLLHTEQRAEQIRRLLRISGPSRRNVIPVVVSLVLLPALIAVAAAQPVVVRQQLVNERADAQGIMLIDTSLSMSASGGFGEPTRIERAKRLAIRLQHALSDVPMGVASMTDRSLPNVLPTTDRTLFERTIDQSVADRLAAAEPALQGPRDDLGRAHPTRRIALLHARRPAPAPDHPYRRGGDEDLAAARGDHRAQGRTSVRARLGARGTDLPRGRQGRPEVLRRSDEHRGAERGRAHHRRAGVSGDATSAQSSARRATRSGEQARRRTSARMRGSRSRRGLCSAASCRSASSFGAGTSRALGGRLVRARCTRADSARGSCLAPARAAARPGRTSPRHPEARPGTRSSA